MLAGCSSSSLLSPRHRLRSESPAQFQHCHFTSSMSTQRLDLPCSFTRKETSRSQPIRPVGIPVEKPIENKSGGFSLKQNIRLPPLAASGHAAGGKGLKRFADRSSSEDGCDNRSKRKKKGADDLSLGQLGDRNFWFQPEFAGFSPYSITGSGEEERLCFGPSEVISEPSSLKVNPIVTEITDFSEKDVVELSQIPAKEAAASGSSSSSDSQSIGRRVRQNEPDYEAGNGFANQRANRSTLVKENNQTAEENQGFELIGLITGCVEAIGSRNIAAINHFIARLGDIASPRGSPLSRLVAYYTEALALRATRLWPNLFHITTHGELDRVDDDSGNALMLLNQVSPIPKFIHFTSNEIMFQYFEGKNRLHIIDFDIKQGLQWPSLFQSLASRANPPSHVRITGIGDSKQELNETADRLTGFAQALNLPFEFHPVVDRIEDVRLWMLHVKEKECVAVNCILQLHKMLYDGNLNAIRSFLSLIRSTNPTVLVMAEQEADHNGPNLETRLANSLKHYSAIFDSFGHSLPLDSPARTKLEETFAHEIRNIIACEGSQRIERHQSFDNWKRVMEEGGYRNMGIRQGEMLQSQMLLKMYSHENFRVQNRGDEEEEDMGITLNWIDQPLYTVSAWTPIEVAGSSSYFSHEN